MAAKRIPLCEPSLTANQLILPLGFDDLAFVVGIPLPKLVVCLSAAPTWLSCAISACSAQSLPAYINPKP